MLLAIPSGLHFNALLHEILNLENAANGDRFSTVLFINLALAAIAVPAAFCLRDAPPRPPCTSAEQPLRGGAVAVAAPQLRSEDSRLAGIQTATLTQTSTMLSGGLSQTDTIMRERRGQGLQRRGLTSDSGRLLRTPSFLLLLAAFSLTVSVFSTLYLFLDEFLDRPPTVPGVNVPKLLGSFGGMAFIAGAPR